MIHLSRSGSVDFECLLELVKLFVKFAMGNKRVIEIYDGRMKARFIFYEWRLIHSRVRHVICHRAA